MAADGRLGRDLQAKKESLSIALRGRILGGALAVLLCVPSPLRCQSGPLRFRFARGDEVVTVETVSQETTTSMMGQEASSVVHQEMRVRRRVEDVLPDGSARLVHTVVAIEAEAETPLGSESWSSEDPATAPGAVTGALRNLPGHSVRFSVSPRGNVDDIEGLDASLFPVAVPGQSGEQVMEGFRAALTQAFPSLPAGDVAPGQAWSSDFDMAMPNVGRMVTEVTYTLRGRGSGGEDTITLDFTMAVRLEVPEAAPLTATATVNEAEGWVTLRRGLPIDGASILDLTIDVVLRQGAQEQQVTQRLVQSQTTSLAVSRPPAPR